ncbi:hypothetical protein [Streptomyces sp. NPDC001635]
MSSPTPLLVVPALLWTAVAGASLITSIVLTIRTRRRDTASAVWNPFGPDFPAAVTAAIAGYAVAAVVRGHFSVGSAAFAILWPTMAASALAFAVRGRNRSWPQWAGPAFAAVGAALYGSLPT